MFPGIALRMVSCVDAVEAVAKPMGLACESLDSRSSVEFDLTYSDWDCEWTLTALVDLGGIRLKGDFIIVGHGATSVCWKAVAEWMEPEHQ